MAYMTARMRNTLRRAVHCGSFLRAHPFVWKVGQPFPELDFRSTAHWYANVAVFFGYMPCIIAKLGQPVLLAESLDLLALFSVLFVLLLYSFEAVLQFTVIAETEEIVEFIQKLCSHMMSTGQNHPAGGVPVLIKICENIMIATFYGTITSSIILASIACYQLDGVSWMEGMLPGKYSGVIVRIMVVLIHAYMGYVHWCLVALLAPLFFAVAFTVIVALNELST